MTWYNKYYINYDNTYNKYDYYLMYLKHNSISNKVVQLEKEYLEKLEDVAKLSNNKVEINKIQKKNSLDILQKELDIIKLLSKYTQQNSFLEYDFVINITKLLYILSQTLMKRLGQKELNIEKKNNNPELLQRCSYKFCEFSHTCIYNYDKNTKTCYHNHYVHNMVCSDLSFLLIYLENKKIDNKKIQHNKEILKTINTLLFVIEHMEKELRTKNLESDLDIELLHIVKPSS